ncbi:MAG: CPBP family intramembrane metalloprotease [Bacteroidales bacterium]|nr:CPBP family intramembrane metalloprotease [Bacteroidales bacterium]
MYSPKSPLLSSLTPFSRLLFSVLLIISCFALTFLLGLVIAIPLFGMSIQDIMNSLSNYNNEKTLWILQYFQVLQSFGLFILPALLAGFLFERNTIRFLALNKTPKWSVYLILLLLMFATLPLINWMVSLNEMMRFPEWLKGVETWMKSTENEATQLTEAFLKMPTFNAFLFNLLMIAVLPAIGEEFLFRGLLQRLLKEWLTNIHLAIFFSAFLFSAMHLQFYGFLPRFMLGILFGYLFYWTGSLWVPITAHFLNNATAIIVSYLGQRSIISGDYENFGATDSYWVLSASFLVTAFLIYLVIRYKNGSDKRI